MFIELTIYSVHTNLFNVVTICAERTPLGTYKLTPTLYTVRLLLILESLSLWALVLAIAFVACTLAFAVRLAAGLVRHDWRLVSWLRAQPWNTVDTLLVMLSAGALALFGWRDRYVGRLLERLAAQRNNAYASFAYAVLADRLLTGWCGVLVAAATVRLCKVLQFMRVFRAIGGTLSRAAASLAHTTVAALLLVVGLALAACQLCSGHTRTFSTLGRGVAALTVLAFGFADSERIGVEELMHGGRVAGVVLLVVLTVTVYVVLLNVFVTIVCQSFGETRHRDEAVRTEAVPFGYGTWLAEESRLVVVGWRRATRRWKCWRCGECCGYDATGDELALTMDGRVARAEARMELLNVQLCLIRDGVMGGGAQSI